MALEWNKSWKQVGQKTQAQSLRHERNETTRQRQQKANLNHVKQQLQIKTARFKLAEGARKRVATQFSTQTQVIPRRDGVSRRGTTSRPNSLAAHEHQFQVNKGKASELAKLINKPVVEPKKQATENSRTQTAGTEGKQVVLVPQAVRVPDKGKKTKAAKGTRGDTKAKAEVKAKAQKVAKQVKPEAKLPDAKRASQAGVAAAAVNVKGHTGKKEETKLEKKQSSLTENVGKKHASALKKLNEGGGSAQADVNVNVTAKGSEEWQASESEAVGAKEVKSRYEFGKGEIVEAYNEPGPIDEVRKQAKALSHKVLQPKVANAARVNEYVTEQLEKIALSKKIDTDDPELRELFSKCRISSGGPYGGMHA